MFMYLHGSFQTRTRPLSNAGALSLSAAVEIARPDLNIYVYLWAEILKSTCVCIRLRSYICVVTLAIQSPFKKNTR